jgi:predicted Zn-dependent protease
LDISPYLQNLITNYGLLMPFSRICESEADHIGLLLMSQACYNPEAALGLWQRMSAAQKEYKVEFLSTHPSKSTEID